MVSYFVILLDELEVSVDAPDAIFRSVEIGRGRLEHLNREDRTWVDNPELIGYFRGEPGAEPISEEQARRIVEAWGFEASILEAPSPMST